MLFVARLAKCKLKLLLIATPAVIAIGYRWYLPHVYNGLFAVNNYSLNVYILF